MAPHGGARSAAALAAAALIATLCSSFGQAESGAPPHARTRGRARPPHALTRPPHAPPRRADAARRAQLLAPNSCAGTTLLSAASGRFSDGAGAYAPGLNCTWLISPAADAATVRGAARAARRARHNPEHARCNDGGGNPFFSFRARVGAPLTQALCARAGGAAVYHAHL
jgi:hypothetical protein